MGLTPRWGLSLLWERLLRHRVSREADRELSSPSEKDSGEGQVRRRLCLLSFLKWEGKAPPRVCVGLHFVKGNEPLCQHSVCLRPSWGGQGLRPGAPLTSTDTLQ